MLSAQCSQQIKVYNKVLLIIRKLNESPASMLLKGGGSNVKSSAGGRGGMIGGGWVLFRV